MRASTNSPLAGRGVAKGNTVRQLGASLCWIALVIGAWLLVHAAGGCGGDGAPDLADAAGVRGGDGGTVDAIPGAPDGGLAGLDAATTPTACAAGPGGLACLFSQWDRVRATCDAPWVSAFLDSIDARHGALPAWHAGRALFVSRGERVAVAGELNDWSTTATLTTGVCGTDVYAAEVELASGRYEYKLVRDGVWQLDPENWAFAFDDYEGNPDRRNSVLNTYDSGLGHLVRPDMDLCSAELGNCRPLTAYVPAGYEAPENATRRYPALFMHDGQNIFDDADCCFGFGGWEVNVTLDEEIAAARVAPIVVVGFDHAGSGRTAEYGFAAVDGGARETFMRFQTDTVQPTAAALWRLDPDRYYTAGSSLGGHVSFALAVTDPDVYAGAASLSGSFWVGGDSGAAVRDLIPTAGSTDQRLYMDHGGTSESGGDNYDSNVELRELLVAAGWVRGDWPACAAATMCYFHDVGATHDELAWRERTHQFLRFLFPAD